MSSTELTLDQRDISFAMKEWLPIEQLSESEKFSEFDVDTLDMMVQEGIRFAIDVVSPTRTESDREGCHIEDGRVKVAECLHEPYKQAYELGWATMRVSQEYGGIGAPATLGLIINEALNGANLGLSMFFGLTSGAAELIDTFGSTALKQKYAAKMFQGQYTGTMCLSEPQAGSDVGAGTTSAVLVEEGVYKIKGSKCWISSGDNDLGENVIHAVLARVKGAQDGTKGLSLFVVPYTRVNDDGTLGDGNDITVASIEDKLGIHASPTAVLNFGENDWKNTIVKVSTIASRRQLNQTMGFWMTTGSNMKFPTLQQQISLTESDSGKTFSLFPEKMKSLELGFSIVSKQEQLENIDQLEFQGSFFKNDYINKMRVTYLLGLPVGFYENIEFAQMSGFEGKFKVKGYNQHLIGEVGFSKYNISDMSVFPFKSASKITGAATGNWKFISISYRWFSEGEQVGLILMPDKNFAEIELPPFSNYDLSITLKAKVGRLKGQLSYAGRNLKKNETTLGGLLLRDTRRYITFNLAL